ncbi:ATP-binding cassette domain-containing protein [Curtobacterium pusillum]|uniref:ATP-binding cassette domain-containing protein n=1 Tax=Curtobacterium pusillum TaxID=69373 RepID=UPI00119D8A90|nr:ABC transporter ATP-binding protein [Curtobacterium pusillum]
MTASADPTIVAARSDRNLLALGHVASFVASLFELVVPLVIAFSVNTLALHGTGTPLTWLPVAIAVIGTGATAGWRAVVLARIGAEEMRRLRLGVARRLLVMTPRAVEQFGVGEAVSIFSRTVNELEPLLSAARIRRRTAVVVVVGCLVLLFWFDWRLATALFGALTVGAGCIVLVLLPVKARAGQALVALGRTAADVNEHLASIRSATVWGLVTPHLRRLEDDLCGVEGAERQIGRAQAVVDLVVKTTSITLLIGLGAFGVFLVSDGALSAARLSGFVGTLAVLLGPAASYAQAAQQVQTAKAAIEHLRGVPQATERTSFAHATAELSARLVVRAVHAECSPAVAVVSGPVSFSATPGEMVCLVGPSGSGKTTVLSAVAALVPVCAGSLTVGGIDVGRHDPSRLWRQIAYVEQTTPTLGASIRDFLTPDPANPPHIDVVMRLLDDFGLTERLGSAGLDTPLERSGTSLSGGERQRLAIVRALASDRPLLLLDEPTAHLDSAAEQRVLEAIDRLRTGRIVIVASHATEFARRADRVVRL